MGEPPPDPKYVAIIQHTSNWDFVWLLAIAGWFRVDVRFVAKHTLFRWPFGWFFRAFGGIPVDRSSHHHLVAQIVEIFRAHDRLVLGIAPEGTRHYADYWKSGFYVIAREAKVPILAAELDYARRRGGFGFVLHPSGDVRADMDKLRAFYAGHTPRHPALAGPIRLKLEEGHDDDDGSGGGPPRS